MMEFGKSFALPFLVRFPFPMEIDKRQKEKKISVDDKLVFDLILKFNKIETVEPNLVRRYQQFGHLALKQKSLLRRRAFFFCLFENNIVFSE